MKNQSCARCPGCKRHCPMNDLHCKYGRNYFEKHPVDASPQKAKDKKDKKDKQKRYAQNGMLHSLIGTGRSIRKALRKEKITEQELLSALSPAEQQSLSCLLAKLALR